MNVKQLRDLLNSGIPNDVVIVIEGRDHTYNQVAVSLQQAVKIKNKMYEYSEEDTTDLEEPGAKLVQVVVIS